MLNENTQAPDFTLTDAAGAPHSLADFRGQWVVLYFYPRLHPPGLRLRLGLRRVPG